MLDHELREQGPPEDFDNTILAQEPSCPRRLYWFLRGATHRFVPAYFTYGKAMGVVLNTWHLTQDLESNPMERAALALQKGEEEWQKDSPIEDKANSWSNLEETFMLYVQNYGPVEPWTMNLGKGELGFRFPIPGTMINYAGAIDAPILWNPYGELFREDKTIGAYITDSYVQQSDYSTQVSGYAWAYTLLRGEIPFGAYMNILSKAHRKEPEKRFQRYLTKRSDWELDKFMTETILLADRIRSRWNPGQWFWPMLGKRDPINCTGGMGRSACLYKRLCLIEAEPWEFEDSYNFSEEFDWRDRWAPWEREGSNE